MVFIFYLLLALDALLLVRHLTFRAAIVCEDYSPCVCEVYQPYGLIVHCGDANGNRLSVSAHDVRNVFNRTTAQHIYWLDLLSLSPENPESGDLIKIPANLLSDKTVDRIAVNCSTAAGPLRLEIHPEAFNSSIQHIGHFEVAGCDLSRLKFDFLANTSRLISLSISRSVRFQGFPPALPFVSRLKSLRIYECLDFQHWNEISVRFPQLESLFLDGTLLGDHSVNQLVSSIASSPTGNDTLQQLSLWENKLTRIPEHISSFRKLSYVNFFGNSIRHVPRGSFVFHAGIRVAFLILSKNSLRRIDPGAFQGDFSEASVYIDFNQLTRFDSGVFQNLLEQMHRSASADAGLYVHNNPFACDCHLAWFIRDNRHLLSRVHGGKCSNGTRFQDLNPKHYDDYNCPSS
ncbi:leucine-rich repeat and immunoglobulin-like domain-containing nogo receptor-interacting protein 3 [Daphnia pulex]|uniref:leucine-rich repeat and immunoglobulin-like domain-containing nogo receptor-interacting protein 3 n=1 Tax=Daphnia pulex TaxID=6669 RepID=UPI001EDFC3B5|nr:leucine-rich repeat and immunoglobulin-like domain-containing nogo receptor-interacting protein 3 [Daphnia pulex]